MHPPSFAGFLPLVFVIVGGIGLPPALAAQKPLPLVAPESLGLSAEALAKIDGAVREALERGDAPGVVVVIVHKGAVVFRKAYGQHTLEPEKIAMLPEIVFDMASLTKPIATATAIMMLVEQGKLKVSDPIAIHLPAFRRKETDQITVEQLLLHTSGFIADNPLADYQAGIDKAWEKLFALKPVSEPGSKFTYSDVNYILLGKLVETLGGRPLDAFTQQHIFGPLGLTDTGFKPQGKLKERAAPTEKRGGAWMIGEVHDPRAFALGGVAGHAGLYSTADDLAVFAQMLLNGGQYSGKRILQEKTVELMTTPRDVPLAASKQGLRTYGWDVQTSYSSNRGEVFPAGTSFGHTGFTGTSLWIDPKSQTAVIVLSNRVHPNGKGNVTKLRGQVATLAAQAVIKPSPQVQEIASGVACLRGPFGEGRDFFPPLPPVLRGERAGVRGDSTPHPRPLSPGVPGERGDYLRPVALGIETLDFKLGIDVLVEENFARLKGRKVGLVTNHTGVDHNGQATIDLLHKAPGVELVALFSPEHGIRGTVDAKVSDTKDEKTGLPIYSLYGERRKPTAATLKGIDTLVFDIQDIGCRFYTYISTLGLVLEAAAENKVKVVILDRPNPIGGLAVEGPVLDPGKESFVAYHRLPIRHGMTVGELALLFNKERQIGADLEVIKLQGWKRGDFYDATGLTWINPSPNMRGLIAALTYPGIGLLETTNLSVGRGTERPFEWLGAPWLDGRKLAVALGQEQLPGVRFVPSALTPTASVFKGQRCGGMQIIVDDWAKFQPVKTGIALAHTLRRLYPDTWQVKNYDRLLGHKATLDALQKGTPWQEVEKAWQPGLKEFLQVRQGFLLYAE